MGQQVSVCHFELAHARENSKRLIPIIFQEADKKQSWQYPNLVECIGFRVVDAQKLPD